MFSVFITCEKTNNTNNATRCVKLGQKRRESSKRNYYIISLRVIIKAIIVITWYVYYNHRVRYHCNQEIMLKISKEKDRPIQLERKEKRTKNDSQVYNWNSVPATHQGKSTKSLYWVHKIRVKWWPRVEIPSLVGHIFLHILNTWETQSGIALVWSTVPLEP